MKKQGRFVSRVALGYFLGTISLLAGPVFTHAEVSAGEPRGKNETEPLQEMVDRAVSSISPAVVRIRVVTADYEQGREEKSQATGSGVIISKEGHVVTNHHVAGKAKWISCTLPTREEIDAELVGTDPLVDISVIRLRPEENREFPVAVFGDSGVLKVGDYVLAIGSPYAFSQSVTMGIVSNTALTIPQQFWPFQFTVEGEDVGSMVRWVGHDASIYGGNSGGPLVNLKGEIVGINEISMGIGAAIPGNLVMEVADKLIRSGKVTRSWFGLELQPLLKHSGQTKGVIVSGTIEGSPADKAGFKSGDILLRVAGKDVNVRFAEELPVLNQSLLSLAVGQEVDAVVLRGGAEVPLKVSSQEREYIRPKTWELEPWGMTACNLSLWVAKEMKRASKDGVLVTTTRPGGPCGEAGPRVSI